MCSYQPQASALESQDHNHLRQVQRHMDCPDVHGWMEEVFVIWRKSKHTIEQYNIT